MQSGAAEHAGILQYQWSRNLLDSRAAAVLDLAFNLGEEGLLKFPGMLRAVKQGLFGRAALELLLSKPDFAEDLILLIDPQSVMTPYALQVGWRAKYNAWRLAKNEEPPEHL